MTDRRTKADLLAEINKLQIENNLMRSLLRDREIFGRPKTSPYGPRTYPSVPLPYPLTNPSFRPWNPSEPWITFNDDKTSAKPCPRIEYHYPETNSFRTNETSRTIC